MKLKKMSPDEFVAIQSKEWRPVKLEGGAIPSFLSGVPPALLHSVYASGTFGTGVEYSGAGVKLADLIGGIDVYRHSPDDPVPLNKDWYPVFRIEQGYFLVGGPEKDKEHWLTKIPSRLAGAEILAIPIKAS